MAANDQQQQQQQQEDSRELREPAHHARRPMNAFLIFCKRHRSSVRKEFPHLENRAVTRVLGEWWATLRPDQKRAYTNLAQEVSEIVRYAGDCRETYNNSLIHVFVANAQYKDAFLNANPDFKWYKLPAPPLRTLTTRPTNKKQEIGEQNSEITNFENESSNGGCNKRGESAGAIQPGKLADESQIGGLSSLFTPQKAHSASAEDGIVDNGAAVVTDGGSPAPFPTPPKKLYTQLPPIDMDQKIKCKADLFSEGKSLVPESNNNQQRHTNEEDDDNIYLDGDGGTPEENNFRGERSCKGLRYQQLMAEQQRNVGAGTPCQRNKRRRLDTTQDRSNERRNSMSSNVSEKTDSLSSEGGNSSRSDLEHLVESAEGKLEASKPEDTETEGAESSHQNYDEWSLPLPSSYKRFKAEDFNLEKKIEALPSLSLEEFQEKKKQQRTKKKKIAQKINAKRAIDAPLGDRKSIDEMPDQREDDEEDADKALLVGSQKRKARKQSITRNALATTSASKSDDFQDGNKPWCATPDLRALACLAEIAANRTKLTK